MRQCYLYLKTQNERIQNRKDSDYFDSYENLYWRPTPWYKRIFNFIYRFLYFITGPQFVVPILGFVQIKVYFFKWWVLEEEELGWMEPTTACCVGHPWTQLDIWSFVHMRWYMVDILIFEMNFKRTYDCCIYWNYYCIEIQLLLRGFNWAKLQDWFRI